MQFQLFPANNSSLSTKLYSQETLEDSQSTEETNPLYFFPSNDSLEFKKHSQATSTIASSQATPRKNCQISTEQEDDSYWGSFSETCDSFYTGGACMKGSECEQAHEGRQRRWGKMSVNSHIMHNFPQLMTLQGQRRIESFLA